MVKKTVVEEKLVTAVNLINGYLNGAISQEQFIEAGQQLVNDPELREIFSARDKRKVQ